MSLRPTSNLKVAPEFQLDKKQIRSKFLYVYGHFYKGSSTAMMTALWASTVAPVAVNSSFGTNGRGIRKYIDWMHKMAPAGLSELKKVQDGEDPHFVFSCAIGSFGKGITEPQLVVDLQKAFCKERSKDELAPTPIDVGNISTQNALARFTKAEPNLRAALGQCLLGLRVVPTDTRMLVFADFKITKAEAEQLTSTAWIEIRNVDLYPMLMLWVANSFGDLGSAPLSSLPVSKIARTMPPVPEGQARVNADGISVSHKGDPYWLPKELNNTARYEDLFSQANVAPEGEGFRLLAPSQLIDLTDEGAGREHQVAPKLPANVAVFIDWVNFKYAYTTTTGLLRVQDLSRFKTADVTHIRNILAKRVITGASVSSFVNVGTRAAHVTPNVDMTAEEWALLEQLDGPFAHAARQKENDLVAYTQLAVEHYKRQTGEDTLYASEISTKGEIAIRPIARFIQRLQAGILNNLDAVYAYYSVGHTAEMLGILTLIAKYSEDFAKVVAEDNENRKAAINQNVEEGWEPPSVPLLRDGIGAMPHQKKVFNLMKDSPDFALLPIQAGGGKTPVVIIDIMNEIQRGNPGNFAVLCPDHLVAQYVKEVTYFTHGQVNVIGVNAYSIRRNGFERLTAMISKAPRNTIVVINYDVLAKQSYKICYGTSTVTVYPVVDFLRQFNFKYAALDESHYVRKESSGRTKATMAFITDIPKKRLASGTMSHDSPSDLANQIAMLDPTVFGDREEFNERFGEVVRGSRVAQWKPGAQKLINDMIRSRVVVAGAMRKEWAALLPTPVEKIIGVNMTPAQMAVYNSVLEKTIEKLKEDAKTNRALAQFVGGPGRPQNEPGDGGEANEEGDTDEGIEGNTGMAEANAESLERLLRPYLTRLEQFCTAPARDPLGDKLLQGDDRLSPKVSAVINRIRYHLDNKLPGKILIFTNYVDSAEEIYENLPEDLKAMTIHYTAGAKVEAGAQFENDDSKQIMVGVSSSMDTGLNLQFASRLIRMETVWNPGTLEQGNARINRPELKKADRRENIYYDWIVADRTIDITKVSRLISKLIAVAKFENSEDPSYETIEDVPIIPMSLEAVTSLNSWSDGLEEYAASYKQYNSVVAADYAAYRAKHGDLKLEPLEIAEPPKDAAILERVPYVAGLELPNAGELGLVRVDDYLRASSEDESDEDVGGDDEENEGGTESKIEQMAKALAGEAVHTEYGDGVIRKINLASRRVFVDFNGYMSVVRMSAAFLITKPEITDKELRHAVAETVGGGDATNPKIPLMKQELPMPEVGVGIRIDRRSMKLVEQRKQEKIDEEKRKAAEKMASMIANINLTISNGFLSLTYDPSENADVAKALEALGFRPTPDYYYAEMKTKAMLVKQFNAWRDADFTIDKSVGAVSGAFQDLAKLLDSRKVQNNNAVFRYSTVNTLKNFYRVEYKASSDPRTIKPYPMIENGHAYIVLPARGQTATNAAIRVRASGVKWMKSQHRIVYYGLNLDRIGHMLNTIQNTGIQLANLKDLRKAYMRLRRSSQKVREDEGL